MNGNVGRRAEIRPSGTPNHTAAPIANLAKRARAITWLVANGAQIKTETREH